MRHENLSSQKKGVALVFGQNAGKTSGMFFFSLEICIFRLNSYISSLEIYISILSILEIKNLTANSLFLPLFHCFS